MARDREKIVECRSCHLREATIPHDGHSKDKAAERLIKKCATRPKLCSVLLDAGFCSGGGVF